MRLFPLLATIGAPLAVLAACQTGATSPLEVSGNPALLSVIPSVAAVNGGKVIKLTARVRNDDGSYSEPSDVAWSSRDGTIATVDRRGLVQGLRAGRTQILATWHESHGSSVVDVIDPVAKKQPLPCAASLATGAAKPGGATCD